MVEQHQRDDGLPWREGSWSSEGQARDRSWQLRASPNPNPSPNPDQTCAGASQLPVVLERVVCRP